MARGIKNKRPVIYGPYFRINRVGNLKSYFELVYWDGAVKCKVQRWNYEALCKIGKEVMKQLREKRRAARQSKKEHKPHKGGVFVPPYKEFAAPCGKIVVWTGVGRRCREDTWRCGHYPECFNKADGWPGWKFKEE